jgi:hypothetical protein
MTTEAPNVVVQMPDGTIKSFHGLAKELDEAIAAGGEAIGVIDPSKAVEEVCDAIRLWLTDDGVSKYHTSDLKNDPEAQFYVAIDIVTRILSDPAAESFWRSTPPAPQHARPSSERFDGVVHHCGARAAARILIATAG